MRQGGTWIKYLDHVSFPKAVGDLIRAQNHVNGSFENVSYSAGYPKEQTKVPTITYRLIRRIPGIDGVETKKPRFRQKFTNEDNKIVEVYSQFMTCLYQWDITADTTQEIDELSVKFEKLLYDNIGWFQSLKVIDVYFEEQLQDDMLAKSTNLEVRSLRFMVLLETYSYQVRDTIDRIRLNLLYPVEANYETVVRGASINEPDLLETTHISEIICVSDEHPDGIAREYDYIKDLDFVATEDPATRKCKIWWVEAGRNPDPGASYYVRYTHFTTITRLYVPTTDYKVIPWR